MRTSVRAPSVLIAMAVSLAGAACGNKDKPATDAQGRVIELAPTSGSNSALNDAPRGSSARPATSSNAPRSSRPSGGDAPRGDRGGRSGSVGAGTAFYVHAVPNVCTNTHHIGDRFSATISESVLGSNGSRIPAGSTVQMRVVESARSEHSKDRAKLAFAPISVTINGSTYTIDGHVTQTPKFNMERVQSTQVQGEKIAAGAAIGAIAGQIIGHDTRSTVIGATVGAAGGTAVAAGTADYDACVPNTGAIQITLDRSLSFRGS